VRGELSATTGGSWSQIQDLLLPQRAARQAARGRKAQAGAISRLHQLFLGTLENDFGGRASGTISSAAVEEGRS
jgi:hypothetical protein